MRLSIDNTDPGWAEACDRGICLCVLEVLVDGVVVEGCRTADEEAGFALCFAYGADGRRPLNVGPAGALVVRRGKVVIRLTHASDGSWPHHGVPEPTEAAEVVARAWAATAPP